MRRDGIGCVVSILTIGLLASHYRSCLWVNSSRQIAVQPGLGARIRPIKANTKIKVCDGVVDSATAESTTELLASDHLIQRFKRFHLGVRRTMTVSDRCSDKLYWDS